MSKGWIESMMRIVCFMVMSLLLCGCNDDTGKVKVIPGAGMANSSMMTGFGKLCEGSVEIFVPQGDALVASRISEGRVELFRVERASSSESRLLSTLQRYPLHIQTDGNKLLAGSCLVNLDTGTVIQLPQLPTEYTGNGETLITDKNYLLSQEGEVLLANPHYYLTRFIPDDPKFKKTSLVADTPSAWLPLGDKARRLNPDAYKGIQAPELKKLSDYSLLLEQGLFVFTGLDKGTGISRLYTFDLLTRKFHLLDSDVSHFEAAPDTNRIAYIKKGIAPGSQDKLMACKWDGSGRLELASRPQLLGFRWSPNGGWLAYSGGEKSKCDIGIVDARGKKAEQLTYGMFSTDRLAWAPEGNLLAFTSRQDDSSSSVYAITLNIQDPAYPPEPVDTARKQLSLQLKELMRQETAAFWKRSVPRKEGS